MERIKTLEELLQKSVAISNVEVTQNDLTGMSAKVNPKEWEGITPCSFNTCNGIVAFIDATDTLRVIPNFYGLVELLKRNRFHQNYLMSVPFADNSYPVNTIMAMRWSSLKRSFREMTGVATG